MGWESLAEGVEEEFSLLEDTTRGRLEQLLEARASRIRQIKLEWNRAARRSPAYRTREREAQRRAYWRRKGREEPPPRKPKSPNKLKYPRQLVLPFD